MRRQGLLFVLFITALMVVCSAALVSAGTISLPKTEQTKCYDTAGTLIACIGTGQDGEIQAGTAWPNPRFTDNGNSTVTDNLTGLIWTKDANAPGPATCNPGVWKTWQGALDYAACLNTNSYLGYNDWRLPNVNELRSLVNAATPDSSAWLNSQGFINAQSNAYWSSTTSAYDTPSAWVVVFYFGSVLYSSKSDGDYVRCVRGGQSGSFGNFVISLPKTGQTKCYNTAGTQIVCTGTGQDGEIQAGVAWPTSRFTDNGNSTVTDNLTGLIWTKDTNAPGHASCGIDISMTWQGALTYAVCLNTISYLGHNDWRLPNINELKSLVNADMPDNSAWLNSQGFINAQSSYYWSSTTYAVYTSSAWNVYFSNGPVYDYPKSYGSYVRCVRGGQSGSLGNCAATLSDSFLLHEPYFTINGSSLWLDLQYAQDSQFPSTDLMFKLSNAGGVTNLSDYSNCQASALTRTGNIYVLRIPILILGGTSYWLDLTYVPTSDGLLWFKLTGINKN